MSISPYVHSRKKRGFDLAVWLVSLPVVLPVMALIGLVVLITEGWPIIYSQKRAGLKGKPFVMYKFRTMRNGAHREQQKLKHLNEADGPVFKIKRDPRFVGVGYWLAKSGMDELPQLLHVLTGEMSLVGPRPLPVDEEAQIPKTYQTLRRQVRPGMISEWVIRGAHGLEFRKWMKLDEMYVREGSLWVDMQVCIKIGIIFWRTIFD